MNGRELTGAVFLDLDTNWDPLVLTSRQLVVFSRISIVLIEAKLHRSCGSFQPFAATVTGGLQHWGEHSWAFIAPILIYVNDMSKWTARTVGRRTFLFITNYHQVNYFVGVFSFAKIFFVGVPIEDTISIELKILMQMKCLKSKKKLIPFWSVLQTLYKK